jgi:hypothetical protein
MALRSMLGKAEEKSQASVISTKHGELRVSTAFTWRRMGSMTRCQMGSTRLWPPDLAGEVLLKRREESFKEQRGERSG